jgi:hypothetical protein
MTEQRIERIRSVAGEIEPVSDLGTCFGAYLPDRDASTAVPVDVDPSRVWDWSDPQFVAGVGTILTKGPASPTSAACTG